MEVEGTNDTMLSLEQMHEMGMMDSVHTDRSRVVTTNYVELTIKKETIKDDSKIADLREGVKIYADAAREAKGAINKQSGIHIDKENCTGEVYFFSLYASPAAMDSHIGKCFSAYVNQILPHCIMSEIITTTGEEDMEFWKTSLSSWQASKLCVLENLNDPEKKPFVDPTPATAEELIALGLPNDFAEDCVKAMHNGEPESSTHRCVMESIFKIKEDVVDDRKRMADMKNIIKQYSDASRTTEGKVACEAAISEDHNEIVVIEIFNSKEANTAHVGRCLRIATKLFEYVEFDQYIVSCAKGDMEYFTKNGQLWEPKSKMVVMEYI